jgi:hypothetical protein
MTILYILLVISHCAGCAYKGVVYINSPQGEGNVVEKAVSTNVEIPLIP